MGEAGIFPTLIQNFSIIHDYRFPVAVLVEGELSYLFCFGFNLVNSTHSGAAINAWQT